ncbi:MAG TPA: LCP family protein [Patescibacteria group bacterium]|nr:LCP family protein [Patescibacteria group bacterium]
MDRSLNRRPEIQKQSQTQKNTFDNQFSVAKVSLKHIKNTIPNTALLARRQPIDMELPGEIETLRIHKLLSRNKWRRLRRNTTKAFAISLILMIIFGGFIFSQNYLKIHKVFRGGTASVAALKANVNPSLLRGEGSGRVNILLLGRGGGNHEGPDLTDSLMIVSIDPVNSKATLLSLPRDLWVNVPGAGVMKINSAWENGEFKYIGKVSPGSTDPNAISAGFSQVDQTVNQVLGLNINYNLIVDFQAFQQAVDTLGGISVNVPASLNDPTMAWENSNNPILVQAGLQTLTGKKALLYARSRETTSDFARAQRQRDLLLAIESKALTLQTLSDPLKVGNLINEFGNNVASDISIKDAVKMYKIFSKVDIENVNSIDLNNGANRITTGNMNGQSIVLPAAGLFDYSQIRKFISSQFIDPYILKENAKIFILNGTNTPGLATNFTNTLKSIGYNITGEANTPDNSWTQTSIIQLNSKDKYTNHFLDRRFNVKSLNKLPSGITTNGADFVIILGSNEVNASQNQTN